MKWDETMIRNEMERLDAMTGLKGSKLPIEFNNAKRTLGSFHSVNGKPLKFKFSKAYFHNSDFARHSAFDTIRHEYAHYMNCELHGEYEDGPHGKMWKECCLVVGAKPKARYNARENEVYLQIEKMKANIQQRTDDYLVSLETGEDIVHPQWGSGKICRVERMEDDARLEVLFGSGEKRLLSARWLAERCG